MSDEPTHRAGSHLVEKLPERIEVPQDIEDIFDRFQEAANRYVAMRYKRDPEKHYDRPPAKCFYYPNDTRIVTPEYQRELHQTLHSARKDTIPMRHALNALRSFVEALESIWKELGEPLPDCPRDDMGFYYSLPDKVRDLRKLVARQFEVMGAQTLALAELNKQKSGG